ncbi:MAG: AAA family ATPase [Trichodesmium sp. MAG_R01]|nr:AAA family ATPase [Trichodesmium sp. MAG_R01]
MKYSHVPLYTWVDVKDILLDIQPDKLPKWLVWARCYWDELSIGISVGKKNEAKHWLKEVFGSRFRVSKTEETIEDFITLESLKIQENNFPKFRIHKKEEISEYFITLESLIEEKAPHPKLKPSLERPEVICFEHKNTEARNLPIWFEETEEKAPHPKLKPSLARPEVIWFEHKNIDLQPPQIFPSNIPPIVAFHSFRGGVGRTTHALALAQALISEKTTKKRKVLVVDGNLEAPEISSMLKETLPLFPISLADFLALVYGDLTFTTEEAIKLASDSLKSTLMNGIYFLPAFCFNTKLTTLEIKLEDIIEGAKNSFLITEVLANLGKALGVDMVIIDLHSGLSPLAISLILDPRVYRIFVTTLSEQSVVGTKLLLELITDTDRAAIFTGEGNPLPAVIFTQVPKNEQSKSLIIETKKRLLETIQPFLEKDQKPMSIITPFAQSLLVLPQSWKDIINLLQDSGIVEKMRILLEWLPKDLNI